MSLVLAYRDMEMDPKVWVLTRVLPVGAGTVLLAGILVLLLPGIFLSGWAFGLLVLTVTFTTLTAAIWPYFLWERKRQEIDDDLHLFVVRIGVMSLSSSTRSSIFEIASREESSRSILGELKKVQELARTWNVPLPQALRIISKLTPSKRFGDFLERMAYAIEIDEDPKVFFRNEQEAVMEEFRSRYSTTLDRIEIVREVYISLISVTMFLSVMLVVMSMLVGINHYLMSFLIVFVFIVVEIVLWVVINGVLPREVIWYDPKPHPKDSRFHRKLNMWLVVSVSSSMVLLMVLFIAGIDWTTLLLYLAISSTPLLVPGTIIIMEERMIKRRDDAFGAFIRTLGSTSESKGGAPVMGLKRIRWHDFGALTEQVRHVYDRLKLRIDSRKAWSLFVRESRSELISQFLNTYQEGISAGGSPKEVSSLISGHFTTLSSLRKRRYLMADNFAAILYGLTVFISGGMFMIYSVVLEMLSKLGDLGTTSEEIEDFQSLVLLKDVSGLEYILLAAVVSVVLLHVFFSADAVRRFKGGHVYTLMLHGPLLLWTAAISAYLAQWAVGRIL
ncbi:MAG: type II secretion system F family protein [Candidatus Thermoplasmatota archaeon]|nr:type II secretion system F family protein [Candidatus Thermoplasmatota archaeon]